MTSNVETTMHKNVTLTNAQVEALATALAVRAAVLDAQAQDLQSTDDFHADLLTTRAWADECRAISIALRNGLLVPLESTTDGPRQPVCIRNEAVLLRPEVDDQVLRSLAAANGGRETEGFEAARHVATGFRRVPVQFEIYADGTWTLGSQRPDNPLKLYPINPTGPGC